MSGPERRSSQAYRAAGEALGFAVPALRPSQQREVVHRDRDLRVSVTDPLTQDPERSAIAALRVAQPATSVLASGEVGDEQTYLQMPRTEPEFMEAERPVIGAGRLSRTSHPVEQRRERREIDGHQRVRAADQAFAHRETAAREPGTLGK